jgi:hypothetical protein
MKNLAIFILPAFIGLAAAVSFAQGDTVTITAKDLLKQNLPVGDLGYVIFTRKTKDGPSENLTIVDMKVERTSYQNRPAVAITQRWESNGTIAHKAYTVLDWADFSTLLHDTYWKRLGYSQHFDFITRKVSFDGPIAGVDRDKIEKDFNDSFKNYNLNWHSDLLVFTLLPYKDGRTFKIEFFDPGFGPAEEATYTVTGSEMLQASSGKRVDCWVMTYTIPDGSGSLKFWISKKTREVLKEEDSFKTGYRYKYKLEVLDELGNASGSLAPSVLKPERDF